MVCRSRSGAIESGANGVNRKLIVNAPFPLTPQVLSQLKQLSQLEFAIISQAPRRALVYLAGLSGPAVSASTLDIPCLSSSG